MGARCRICLGRAGRFRSVGRVDEVGELSGVWCCDAALVAGDLTGC